MSRDLSDGGAVVSGGANGVGQAMAQEIATRDGLGVVLDVAVDSTSEPAVDERHRAVSSVCGNVRSEADCQLWSSERWSGTGAIASSPTPALPWPDRSTECRSFAGTGIIDVNVLRASHEPRRLNRPAKGGGHLMISGSLGPFSMSAPYSATKYALAGINQSLRMSLASLFCPPHRAPEIRRACAGSRGTADVVRASHRARAGRRVTFFRDRDAHGESQARARELTTPFDSTAAGMATTGHRKDGQ